MINIDLRETYGMKDIKEVMRTIQGMKSKGFTDAEIQMYLELNKMEAKREQKGTDHDS